MVVDFPAPFGPRKPRISPSGTPKVRSSTAIRSRYRLLSPVTSIIAIGLSFLASGRAILWMGTGLSTRVAHGFFPWPGRCIDLDPT